MGLTSQFETQTFVFHISNLLSKFVVVKRHKVKNPTADRFADVFSCCKSSPAAGMSHLRERRQLLSRPQEKSKLKWPLP